MLLAGAAEAQYAPYQVTSTAPSFVSLDASDWGSSGNLTDLTGRIYQPVALDTVLPVSTAGWTTDTLTGGECNFTDLQTAITAAGDTSSTADDNIIIDLATNCGTLTDTTTGIHINIPNDVDGLVIRGDAAVKFQVDPATDACTQYCGTMNGGYADILFEVGASSRPAVIQSWTWSSGFVKGATTIGVSTGIGTDVYAGDIVELTVNDWGSSNMEYSPMYRIVCVRHSDSSTSGTGCDPADNTIVLDRGLPIDFTTPGVYQIGNFTGFTVNHIERKCTTCSGGGTYTQNIPEHVGFETFTTEHTEPHAVRDSFGTFEWNGCFECWKTDVTVGPWGATQEQLFTDADRVLNMANSFTGPLWKPRCAMTVTALSTDTPIKATFGSVGTGTDCASSLRFPGNGGTETAVYFSPDFTSTCNVNLAGNLYFYVATGTGLDNDPTDGSVTLALYDMSDGSAVAGTNCGTPSANYAINLNQYNVASSYALTGASDIQWIDNYFHNTRVGLIWQGGNTLVAAYNYFLTDADIHCSRWLMLHGNAEPASLIEGNDSDCPWTPFAEADQGVGIGPILTYYKNRGRPRDTQTGAMTDQCGTLGGGICVELNDQLGNSSDEHNFFGNVFTGISGTTIDNCDNDDNAATTSPNAPCESPYQLYDAYFARNLYTEETMGADDFDANHPTTSKADYQEGDLLDTAPAGWASTVYPTSLLYRDGELPRSWMCTQSTPATGLIPELGAEYDNMAGTLTKLPAQIRYESGTCTAP